MTLYPHREHHLRLQLLLARRLLEAHEDWLDEVTRELGTADAAVKRVR